MINKEFIVNSVKPETIKKRAFILIGKNEQDAIEQLKSKGYLEPIEIKLVAFCPPTEAQLSYAKNLKIKVPVNASKEDLSALIRRKEDRDSDPSQELIEFAANKRLYFSEYIGKKSLYGFIFNCLEPRDKIAFFVFSIYRWLSEDRQGNLDKHKHREAFYEFAKQQLNDDQFVKSVERYSGSELRFFGLLRYTDGGEHYGGSINTIAYKTCAEFISSKFGTPKTKIGKISSKSEDGKGNGCLGLGLFLTVFIILISVLIFFTK